MATATAPIAVEYEPGLPDRIRVYVGDQSWQIWFHSRHDLRKFLRDAVKYRHMSVEAYREAIEVYEAWWRYEAEALEEPGTVTSAVKEVAVRVFCYGALGVVAIDLYLGAILAFEIWSNG